MNTPVCMKCNQGNLQGSADVFWQSGIGFVEDYAQDGCINYCVTCQEEWPAITWVPLDNHERIKRTVVLYLRSLHAHLRRELRWKLRRALNTKIIHR